MGRAAESSAVEGGSESRGGEGPEPHAENPTALSLLTPEGSQPAGTTNITTLAVFSKPP
jgi:hypothetical protein